MDEENAETPLSVFRELVFLNADNATNFGELSFVPVGGGDVNGRYLDRKIPISGFRFKVLVLCGFA